MSAPPKIPKYIYDLPFTDRENFCALLNENNKWEELAVLMQFPAKDITPLRKEKNPSDELLTMWSHYNHTILELFALLSKMHHYQSMVILKDYVEPKFHILLYQGEANLQRVFGVDKDKKDSKDLKIGYQNFNHNHPSTSQNHEKVFPTKYNPCNPESSEKILNQEQMDQHTNEMPSNSNNLVTSALQIFSSSLPQISFPDLATSTGNWNKCNLLGKGGFGTVYRGIWKNTEVAIKKIEKRGPDSDESYALQLEQSFREIKILNSIPHQNILPLYAYSIDGESPCLVYQCMKNGSLEDRLHLKQGTKPLNWIQRFEIAKGTARGLQYLHTINTKPLIHGDIKSANILLDKNFEPKIGDFGLAKEGSSDDAMKVSRIQGTRPYLPEDYILERKLCTKIDTFSYGIVLFELATGLLAFDKSRPEKKLLKDYVDYYKDKNIHILIDKKAGEENSQVFVYLMQLGSWCSNKLTEMRPGMESTYNNIVRYESELFKPKSA